MNHELNWQVAEKIMGERYLDKDMPDYSGSLDAAWQMEEEIERRGLLGDYVAAPQSHLRILGRHVIEVMETWEFIHATPEQRCEAALEAAREE